MSHVQIISHSITTNSIQKEKKRKSIYFIFSEVPTRWQEHPRNKAPKCSGKGINLLGKRVAKYNLSSAEIF